YRGSFFRPNLNITFREKHSAAVVRGQILDYIRKHPGQSGIIYCWSRKNVEKTAEYLRTHGVPALPYHAGMDPQERRENQEAFISGKTKVVAATIAFGMGINKPDVRFVIHCDMPRTVENYYQEIGRAGRDGKISDCVMYYSWSDVKNYERFLDGAQDRDKALAAHEKTRDFFRMAQRGGCRHKAVLAYFDEHIADCGGSCDCCGAGTELPGEDADDHVELSIGHPLDAHNEYMEETAVLRRAPGVRRMGQAVRKPCDFGVVMARVRDMQGREITTKTGKTFRYRVSGNVLRITGKTWEVSMDDLREANGMWPVDKPSAFEKAGIRSSGTYLWGILNAAGHGLINLL
ncbi:MAG: RecQ family zinc-binding domain-containing protein, partial [Spirochaetia bacterium]|nr:RecQ family zinc-binding domain-containing protein [Spirochaetia bacterium]